MIWVFNVPQSPNVDNPLCSLVGIIGRRENFRKYDPMKGNEIIRVTCWETILGSSLFLSLLALVWSKFLCFVLCSLPYFFLHCDRHKCMCVCGGGSIVEPSQPLECVPHFTKDSSSQLITVETCLGQQSNRERGCCDSFLIWRADTCLFFPREQIWRFHHWLAQRAFLFRMTSAEWMRHSDQRCRCL